MLTLAQPDTHAHTHKLPFTHIKLFAVLSLRCCWFLGSDSNLFFVFYSMESFFVALRFYVRF